MNFGTLFAAVFQSPGCDEAKVFAKLSEGQSDDFSAARKL